MTSVNVKPSKQLIADLREVEEALLGPIRDALAEADELADHDGPAEKTRAKVLLRMAERELGTLRQDCLAPLAETYLMLAHAFCDLGKFARAGATAGTGGRICYLQPDLFARVEKVLDGREGRYAPIEDPIGPTQFVRHMTLEDSAFASDRRAHHAICLRILGPIVAQIGEAWSTGRRIGRGVPAREVRAMERLETMSGELAEVRELLALNFAATFSGIGSVHYALGDIGAAYDSTQKAEELSDNKSFRRRVDHYSCELYADDELGPSLRNAPVEAFDQSLAEDVGGTA